MKAKDSLMYSERLLARRMQLRSDVNRDRDAMILPTRERKSMPESPEDGVSLGNPKTIIEAVAAAKLQRSSYYGVRRITCEFHEGVLTLRGCVPSYYLKQIAQTLVRRVDGVEELNNRVRVVSAQS